MHQPAVSAGLRVTVRKKKTLPVLDKLFSLMDILNPAKDECGCAVSARLRIPQKAKGAELLFLERGHVQGEPCRSFLQKRDFMNKGLLH